MTCGEAREALSALFDGEAAPVEEQGARQHLETCGGCRTWRAQVEQVTRLVRVRSADDVPDLTERVLAAVATEQGAARDELRRRHARRRRWGLALRALVAGTAFLQLVLALPDLLASHGYGLHAGREGASFDVAMAVGMLFAARYPDRARALLPVAVVLAGTLAVTTGIDLAGGATTLVHELGHALVVVQAGVLWALGRGDQWEAKRATAS